MIIPFFKLKIKETLHMIRLRPERNKQIIHVAVSITG